MKVKSTELRIGNYIECFGIREITDINRDKIKVQHESEKGNFICEWCPINSLELKPIQITKDWLIDLGFRYNDTNNMYFLPIPNLKCEIHATLFRGVFVIELQNHLMPIVTECDYVHDLQNLFYALCKKELTYKS